MEDQMAQVADVNTGLNTVLEGYKFSESSPYDFRRTSATAGPSGTQNFHPHRHAVFNKSISASSFRDTENEISWFGQMRGGARSNWGAGGQDVAAARGQDGGATGGQDGRAAGGQDGGAAGGQDGGAAADPPAPLDPPRSGHGGPGGRRMSQKQSRIKQLESAKPIKFWQQKRFDAKPGDDSDTWWVWVQLYIEDQPEKLPKNERTID